MDYNERHFYLTFETKIKWIVLGMIASTLLNDGWVLIVVLFLYLLFGLFMKAKLQAELENNKQISLNLEKERIKQKELEEKKIKETIEQCDVPFVKKMYEKHRGAGQ